MLIIETRDSDTIDKALKKYKKRFEKAGILKELRYRQAFEKPSVVNRTKRLKAIFREQYKLREAQG